LIASAPPAPGDRRAPNTTGYRCVLLSVSSLLTTLLTGCFTASLLYAGVPTLLAVPLLGIFVVLVLWIAVGFVSAVIGFFRVIDASRRRRRVTLDREGPPLCAIIVPIYNEDAPRVFAGLEATRASIARAGRLARFQFFVLSDTTDSETWLEEEACFQRWLDGLPADERPTVHYRHRVDNARRKVGNIDDFLDRFSDPFRYMIILDADSVMDGRTVADMVARMEADPNLGILQAPPVPVNRVSLFARLQQFASAVYGPIFTTGLATWSGGEGNYYGHNAVIRLEPFRDHCRVPTLPGDGPFGGEIMSHDFVEAAMMRRAGYRVEIGTDLIGSYEELPTTLIDFVKRDQRWCQGNLQHLGVLRSEKVHHVSTIHMLNGVMSYVSGALWAVMLVLGFAAAIFASRPADAGPPLWPNALGIGAFIVVMGLLLVPKALALIALGWYPERIDQLGGRSRLVAGVVLETLASILTAPVFMVFYTRFVVVTLLGGKVGWNTQDRDERRITLADAIDAHGPQLVLGVVMIAVAQWIGKGMVWWTLPIWLGLLLSIPLSITLSSVSLGRLAARLGLFTIRQERHTPRLLTELTQLLDRPALAPDTASDLWIDRLRDDVPYNALHRDLLDVAGAQAQPLDPDTAKHVGIIRLDGARYLPNDARRAVLNHPIAVHRLLDGEHAEQRDEADADAVIAHIG